MKKKLDSITERPWYAVDKHVQSCNLETDGYVCQCDTEADAEFIVKVANNYNYLLTLSKELVKVITEAENDQCYSLNEGIHHIAIDRAHKVLKKLISKIGG